MEIRIYSTEKNAACDYMIVDGSDFIYAIKKGMDNGDIINLAELANRDLLAGIVSPFDVSALTLERLIIDGINQELPQ